MHSDVPSGGGREDAKGLVQETTKDAGKTQWVLQVIHGQPRLGQLIDTGLGFYRVRFEENTYDWETLPSSARLIDEDSLEFRALTQPEVERARIQSDPASVVRDLLASQKNGLSASDIGHELSLLALAEAEEWKLLWKKAQVKLKKDRHVLISERPTKYSFSSTPRAEAPDERVTARQMLEAASKKLPKAKKDALLTRIVELDSQGELSFEERAWVSAIKAGPISEATWATLRPGNLPATGSAVLLDRAETDSKHEFVVRLALEAKDSEPVRRARDLAEEKVPVEVLVAGLASELDRWRQDLRQSDDDELGRRTAGALRRTPTLERLWRRCAQPRLVAEAMKLFADAREHPSERREVKELADWSLGLVRSLGWNAHQFSQVIERLDGDESLKIFVALVGEPLHQDGLRRSFLRAAVRAGRTQAVLSRRPWSDLGVKNLRELLDDALLGDLLTNEPLLHSVVAPAVSKAADAGDFSSMVALLSAPRSVVELCPPERWAKVIAEGASLNGSERVLQAIPHAGGSLERMQSELDAALARIATLEGDERTLRGEVEALEERLRDATGEHLASIGDATRRAKLQAFRLLAEALEEIRPASAEAPAVEDAIANVLTRAAHLGLRVSGEPGGTVPFDPLNHDAMGVDILEGATVQLLDAGYEVSEDGQAVVIRKARVRRTEV